ncbi:hypothetical protein NEPAR06_1313 [Nematocida parisii]|uniref:Gamma-soluble NSF attachment protein n=1 Tax=Nematocida parisii (strain ERTm3) TaxID=935791 RepID=I3EEC8_NEMP3|nr:uncharacterized protein NEPG_02201 [Nematocida parisii ERTm1]EIJ87575.1 hypothetical protein NEQG_02122 [Nematocida parisii ERTm3]KAI5145021.1 hypothetical protein NEPAR07_1416 [Nematocida parisii]EIJ92802.1 hypothetical protein NEPG_02201 [Nematocida parisii ERTm1]KAI5154705.1 hypothetical protein NEPAR06_1313 [Nematocida parisii]KAI5157643.1 hypothetical protein NEPAR05_1460 [Nematocida parisii]|eukprot:XP_013060028.1 hypothetical protein NEPG_02201 [Nematocida parisii ERTm1]
MHASPEELEREADQYTRKRSNFIIKMIMSYDTDKAVLLYEKAGQAYSRAGRHEKAAEMYSSSANILIDTKEENNKYEIFSYLEKSAESLLAAEKKEEAISVYKKALNELSMSTEATSVVASLTAKIGGLLRETDQEKEALKYFYRAADVYGRSKMHINKRNILIQCAASEIRFKNYEKAFDLYKALSNDKSEISHVLEKTSFLFLGVLCGIILEKTKDAYELLNQMDDTRTESQIAYRMLDVKTKRSSDQADLEKTIEYFKRTNKLSSEVTIAMHDAQVAIDPNNDIL